MRLPALPAMTQRERRVLTVGSACIIAMIAFAKVLPGIRKWEDDAAVRQALLTRELATGQVTVAQERAMRDSLKSRTRALQSRETGLLQGESRSAAEGALAAVVSATAASAGLKIDALALDGEIDEGVQVVSVTGAATGDIAGLTDFFAALERAPSRPRVRAVSITPSDAAGPDTRAETLRLEFTIDAQVIAAGRRLP